MDSPASLVRPGSDLRRQGLDELARRWPDRASFDAYVRAIGAMFDRVQARDARVLELGSGFGHITFILSLLGARYAVGADIWEERVHELGRLRGTIPGLPGRVGGVQVGGVDLPFRDGSFDGVVVNEVISHVADLDGCLAEVARVLVPGGRLYIFDDNNALDLRGRRRRRRRVWPERDRSRFAPVREALIREQYPDLPPERVQALVAGTAGLLWPDIQQVVEAARTGRPASGLRREHIRHPLTGEFGEREFNPYRLARRIDGHGFRSRVVPTRFSVVSWRRRAAEAVLRWTHPLSLVCAPGFTILARKLG